MISLDEMVQRLQLTTSLSEVNADLKWPVSVLGPSARPPRNDTTFQGNIHSYLSILEHHDMSDQFNISTCLIFPELYHHLFVWIQPTKIKTHRTWQILITAIRSKSVRMKTYQSKAMTVLLISHIILDMWKTYLPDSEPGKLGPFLVSVFF